MKERTVRDSKGRILLTTERVGERLKVNMHRYKGMTDDEKSVVVAVFEAMKTAGDGTVCEFDGRQIEDIMAFLNFNDDEPDFCG